MKSRWLGVVKHSPNSLIWSAFSGAVLLLLAVGVVISRQGREIEVVGSRMTSYSTPTPTPQPLINDAFPVPSGIELQQLRIAATSNGPGYAPGYGHTSDYMLGTVSVAVILPESSGGIDPDIENWTATEIAAVRAEVVKSLEWWEAKAAANGVSVDFRLLDGHPLKVPTAYEPIMHRGGPSSPSWACGDEDVWIDDVMKNLGYNKHDPLSDHNHILEVRDYDNDLRRTYGTDWAITIFLADAERDDDDQFAYADCNGTVRIPQKDESGTTSTNSILIEVEARNSVDHSSNIASDTLTVSSTDRCIAMPLLLATAHVAPLAPAPGAPDLFQSPLPTPQPWTAGCLGSTQHEATYARNLPRHLC